MTYLYVPPPQLVFIQHGHIDPSKLELLGWIVIGLVCVIVALIIYAIKTLRN